MHCVYKNIGNPKQCFVFERISICIPGALSQLFFQVWYTYSVHITAVALKSLRIVFEYLFRICRSVQNNIATYGWFFGVEGHMLHVCDEANPLYITCICVFLPSQDLKPSNIAVNEDCELRVMLLSCQVLGFLIPRSRVPVFGVSRSCSPSPSIPRS